jgi:arsenite methyltransferase
VQRHVTLLAPFMVVFRSAFQRPMDLPTLQRARAVFADLSAAQQSNFHGVTHWFRGGGFALPCDLA